ncbi:hypothetical protein B0T17DRAFT_504497 [Bombardia bombarda]|uniref:Uncharacterized protein n=1 Tax=Bombardia bombarda TaxID=252184 RepID=A0AA40CGY3_9PEZI|nr:hypothetical protein B0T17DRAFT_504497 [Bombardia bombarda]
MGNQWGGGSGGGGAKGKVGRGRGVWPDGRVSNCKDLQQGCSGIRAWPEMSGAKFKAPDPVSTHCVAMLPAGETKPERLDHVCRDIGAWMGNVYKLFEGGQVTSVGTVVTVQTGSMRVWWGSIRQIMQPGRDRTGRERGERGSPTRSLATLCVRKEADKDAQRSSEGRSHLEVGSPCSLNE